MTAPRALAGLLLAIVLPSALAPAGEEGTAKEREAAELARGKALFQRYVALEQAFDPALADLYADEAQIVNMKRGANGRQVTVPLPAPQYRQLLLHAMTIARERGDKHIYSELRFTREERGVRVTGLRISLQEKTSSPVSILFGPARDGRWGVLEEVVLSGP